MNTPPTGGEERPPLGRALVGGFLMGLANLVPGISGGTMILAVGLYDRFVGAVADVTRLRLRPGPLAFLGCLAVGIATALLSLSGVAVDLVADQRWIMYSLFVGLTLGGAPALFARSRPLSPAVIVAVLAGVGAILALANEFASARLPQTAPVMVAVGAAAAASMILPGISGSTVLLILGMYELVIGSVSASALREDFAGSLQVLVPVGLGAAIGIALLSNLLKVLLARFPAPSHGALLGLLLGSVAILWPFQEPVHAELARRSTRTATAMVLEGASHDVVRARCGEEFDDARLADLAQRYAGSSRADLKELGEALRTFRPSAGQVGASLGLVVVGFVLTRLLGRRDA